jgi:hypothetical protein
LLSEGLGRRGARRRGGRDREDVGDHDGELLLPRLWGIARARVWSRGIARRAGLLLRLLGLSDGFGRRLPDDYGEAGLVMGGRRRRRHGRGRGRLGLSPPIEEVVDVEVGGEGEALFGVQPVEPYRRASGGGGGGGEQRLAARHCLPSSPLRLRRWYWDLGNG